MGTFRQHFRYLQHGNIQITYLYRMDTFRQHISTAWQHSDSIYLQHGNIQIAYIYSMATFRYHISTALQHSESIYLQHGNIHLDSISLQHGEHSDSISLQHGNIHLDSISDISSMGHIQIAYLYSQVKVMRNNVLLFSIILVAADTFSSCFCNFCSSLSHSTSATYEHV